jgi:hypothetical protein
VTAPTSPKPATPADPNDLRTALTKLADGWNNQAGARDPEAEVRALLAAHPAPETAEARREDVEAGAEAAWRASQEVNGFAEDSWTEVSEPQRESWRHVARAVLAVLPAPPVVDEAEVRERIAQDIEAAARTDLALGLYGAIDIARGATR